MSSLSLQELTLSFDSRALVLLVLELLDAEWGLYDWPLHPDSWVFRLRFNYAFLGLQLDDSRLWDFSASVTWEPVPVINPDFHMYL